MLMSPGLGRNQVVLDRLVWFSPPLGGDQPWCLQTSGKTEGCQEVVGVGQ